MLHDEVDDPGRHNYAVAIVEEDILLANWVLLRAAYLADGVQRAGDVGSVPSAADLRPVWGGESRLARPVALDALASGP